MKISVIVPTRQSARHIGDTLASISAQSLPPNELVVSDDASTDDTLNLARAFAASSSIQTTILRHTPCGISANYLHALRHTTGDIVVVADHDDVWLPERVATIAAAFLADREVSVVALDSEMVDETLAPLGTTLRGGKKHSRRQARAARKDDFALYLKGAALDAHTMAFRAIVRDIVLRIEPEALPHLWFDNCVSCSALSVGRLAYPPQALTLYRQHGSQHTSYEKSLPRNHFSRDVEPLLTRLRFLRTSLERNRSAWLFGEKEGNRRLRVLAECEVFHRLRIANRPTAGWYFKLMAAFLGGTYQRFSARPSLSFAKDIYLAIRQHAR